jgi:muramidase (phage lysozyme)
MPLPPGASARDRWLELADEARAKTQDALANGNHRMAGLWDEHERTLLRNAYDDVPFPDDAPAGDAPETGLDAGDDSAEGYIQTVSADDDRAFEMAANAKPAPNRAPVLAKGGKQPKPATAKGSVPARKPLPPEKQADNIKKAREAMSSPEVYAFMQAISAGEGDYDQLVGGERFTGTEYPGKASGAYQVTSRTRRDVLLPELGLTDFSRDTQDVMGAHLIRNKGALEDIQKGRVDKAVEKLRGTWPSLPGGNQTKIDMEQFKARYKEKLDSLLEKLGSSITQ